MNRNEEYYELMQKLENPPLKLDYTLERARARKSALTKRKKTSKAVLIPLGTLVTVFALFTALVNFSEPFAEACGEIPVLSRLAEAVSFNPSLSAAVENEYVQEIGQEQTINGVTAKIEYVIVDQKQLHIFYSLNSSDYSNMDGRVELSNARGRFSVLSWYSDDITDGELRRAVVNYDSSSDMPDNLDIILTALDMSGSETSSEGNEVASFDFHLEFDPKLTSEGETVEVGQTFELDGQTLTLEKAEIYPTHTRLIFSEASDNTVWLKNLNFYIEDENGNHYNSSPSGLSATGSVNGRSMTTYYAESPYFAGSENLTLFLTGARWLNKGEETVHVELVSGTAEGLPDGVELARVKSTDTGYELIFVSETEANNSQVSKFDGVWYDAEGKSFSCTETMGYTGRYYDNDTGESFGDMGSSTQVLYISCEPCDELWVELDYSSSTDFSVPYQVTIK
ncbi:MAG: DUF4179 domain-containing protein [Clostridia bacterium]|nr:DUF4179 domain-containing protein [Clostridia bacterium]